MPSLAAALIASIAGWMLDAVVAPFLGFTARLFLSLIVTPFVFVYARNWLRQLRDG